MENLDTPAVLVDQEKLEANISDMADFCRSAGVNLRPHVKAHKMPQIARKQVAAGAVGVTAATLREAEVMIDAGIRDILIARQVAGEANIRRLLRLIEQADLTVAVDSIPGARKLADALKDSGKELAVMIEVNSGLDRCGVLPGAETVQLARELVQLPGLKLKGLFTHAGQAYGANSPEQVADLGKHEGEVTAAAAALLYEAGIPVETISVGSTPTAKIAGAVKGVTEVRPGNYCFYDAIQVSLGVASADRCALFVTATVISKPAAWRMVIDAGSKTFALDQGAHGTAAVSGFGIIKGYPHLRLTRLSEEHGIIESAGGTAGEPALGEQLQIIPNHACVVVNLADAVLVTHRGMVVDRWAVAARGFS